MMHKVYLLNLNVCSEKTNYCDSQFDTDKKLNKNKEECVD